MTGAVLAGYHQLESWQRGMDFAVRIYEVSADLPEEERFNLTSQMRRAATSVPLNIAEGSGKFSRDAVRFYAIARGSALECAAVLDALAAMGVFEEEDLRAARELLERIVSMLTGLIRP